jgi:hypothetical protein
MQRISKRKLKAGLNDEGDDSPRNVEVSPNYTASEPLFSTLLFITRIYWSFSALVNCAENA